MSELGNIILNPVNIQVQSLYHDTFGSIHTKITPLIHIRTHKELQLELVIILMISF